MSELADNCIDLDAGCDSETIKRLFPRCQPKKYDIKSLEAKHDLNLNKIVDGKSILNNNEQISCNKNQNDNASINKLYQKSSWQEKKMEEDHSVHSAYHIAGRGIKAALTGNGSTDGNDYLYDESLDVGYRIKTLNNLDNSRIEVAGGREKISQSLLRTAKKKHSDETARCNPHSGHKSNQKRYSGEVLYDDDLKEYKVRSYAQPHNIGNKSHKAYKNFSVQNDVSRYSAPRRISPTSPQDETSQSIEQEVNKSVNKWIYETPVSEAMEVVYDDIGAMKNKPDPNSANSCSPKISVENYDELQPNMDNEMQVSSGENTSNSSQQQSPSARIARVIGNVPIAEYDGSPRRYGPRPGYPHRISKSDLSNTDKSFHDAATSRDSPPNQSNEKSDGEFFSKSKSNAKQANGDIHNETVDQRNGTAGSHDNEFSENTNSGDYSDELEYKLYRLNSDNYIGKRLAQSVSNSVTNDSPKKSDSSRSLDHNHLNENSDYRLDKEIDENDVSECGLYNMLTNDRNLLLLHDRIKQHNILSDLMNHDQDRESMSNPDTEDLGETEIGEQVGHSRNFTLSPETTDCDSNDLESELSVDMNETCSLEHSSNSRLYNSMPILEDGLSSGNVSEVEENCDMDIDGLSNGNNSSPSHYSDASAMNKRLVSENPTVMLMKKQINEIEKEIARHTQKPDSSPASSRAEYSDLETYMHEGDSNGNDSHFLPNTACSVDREFLKHLEQECLGISPADTSHESDDNSASESVSQAIREIKEAIQISRNVILKTPPMDKSEEDEQEPVWIRRQVNGHKINQNNNDLSSDKEHPPEEGVPEEDEIEEETDRLLGVEKKDDSTYYEEKEYRRSTMRLASSVGLATCSAQNSNLRPKHRTLEASDFSGKKKYGFGNRSKEVIIHEPAVLIEGVLFVAHYLGSTQLVCEGQPTKSTRMMQAEEAVSRIKAPEGESQPSTNVDLFISTEKIMVLNTDMKEIMMDHALRTISYIADIGDLVVLMARRRPTANEVQSENVITHTPKMVCHVFQSQEAQFIAQSIGQAFQVAYMEFLKANGIEDNSFVKEMDYQEVLNSQQIFGDELEMFAKKDKQKEVIVPKGKGEILGMVIVESGWGSMLPTVVIANMAQGGPAARCGQLNIGDQIIAINGVSLVGLPLSTCQTYIKNTRNQTVVKLTMVPCPPVVEVKIKRPDTKYQLGFSVQNGVICSLLRGGIAERGGVRVGHRIIEINNQSVVAVPHERIVNLLATSVGEINMKTMPTSMFRLLTGQDAPIYI